MHHPHFESDVRPGTVTLCLVDQGRVCHVPTDRVLWDGADEELRTTLSNLARQRFQHRWGVTDEVRDALPVEVVRGEDAHAQP
ncbi:hypothetical protein J7E96_19355 [Streptomyces sp. ISL-96]|uniref:hypothetical protein n=1 Tax=Streptomyces sp. ISL-96 TaxID=2819191 RepID=UPI001BE51870|nr:hypothetical protein [Streptomyces sp. ISL-96]MBT2490632.1 hypothetical protein [Streptomyces sp. ISL-96]